MGFIKKIEDIYQTLAIVIGFACLFCTVMGLVGQDIFSLYLGFWAFIAFFVLGAGLITIKAIAAIWNKFRVAVSAQTRS